MYRCPHCKQEVEELELYFEIPKGCQCDPTDWGDPDNIPPACDKFIEHEGGLCAKCEHEELCHNQKVGSA